MGRRAALAVLAAGLLAAWPRAAPASPLQMFGAGGRSPALGATGVADAGEFDAVYLNPAGLADIPRKRLTVGTLHGSFQLDGVDRFVAAANGVEVGGALPIPLGGWWRNRVGLGVGIYIPSNVINRARAPRPGTPWYTLLENRSQVVGLQVGAGVRLSERWSVGASFLALAALRGRIEVSTDAAGRFTTTSEQQLVSHFAPIAGARWSARAGLDVGLTVRLPSRSSYDIVVANDLGDTLPLTLPELRIAGVAQYDPLTVAAEAAWRPARSLAVSGQLAWERWSAFPSPTENPVTGGEPVAAPAFRDTLVPHAGVEWRTRYLALRGGAFFAPTPAPAAASSRGLLDNHRLALTSGLGLNLSILHLDAWFQAHLLVPRDHDTPSGRIRTSGSILAAGLTLGVDL